MNKSRMSVSNLGEKLRMLREGSKMSLQSLSAKIGVDASLLAKLERNERVATQEQIKKIASFFKIEEKELIQEKLSDLFAHILIEENMGVETLKITQLKIKYLKSNSNEK